jgi:cold shock CspA family protein
MTQVTTNQESKKMTGRCKWFDTKKGFGFIEMDDNSSDVFVHQSSLYCKGFRSLQDGEAVEFNLEVQGDGRRKAINVTGPNGAYCVGQQRQQSFDDYGNNSYNNNSGGYRSNYNNNNSGYNNNRGGYGYQKKSSNNSYGNNSGFDRQGYSNYEN